MYRRKPAVEGSFYPGNPTEVTDMINLFDSKVEFSKNDQILRPRILISPHAGLFFSGLTATFGYKLAANFIYDRIVIFAPSHRVYFEGMSASIYESYIINKKNIYIDTDFTEKISNKFNLKFIEQAHRDEHSAEIQFPFIDHYFPGLPVSVFVYGGYTHEELSKITNHILVEYPDSLIVMSSDLSHFHPYDECNIIDGKLIKGINDLDLLTINNAEACGMTGIKAAVESSKKNGLAPKILDYRNSGDIIPDKSGVVGYLSAVFIKKT